MLLIKNYQSNIILAGLVFIVDRIFKSRFYFAENSLFNYTKNLGIAFGIPLPKTFLLLMVISIIAILSVLSLIAWQRKSYLNFSAYVCIILGALSNLIDRLYYGSVIDYIDLKIWPIFNLADVLIFTGVILVLYQLYRTAK